MSDGGTYDGPPFHVRAMPEVNSDHRLAPMAERAGRALLAAKHTVVVCENTAAGLTQAALQSVSGASTYVTCSAVAYNPKKAIPLLGDVLPDEAVLNHFQTGFADGAAYIESKKAFTAYTARRLREKVGATWCVSEGGATGPTFRYEGITKGFTAVFVAGPIERGVIFESTHAQREQNMWAFAQAALDLLAECVEEAAAAEAASTADTPSAGSFSGGKRPRE